MYGRFIKSREESYPTSRPSGTGGGRMKRNQPVLERAAEEAVSLGIAWRFFFRDRF